MELFLEAIQRHERLRAHDVWLTQPMGGGRIVDLTFAEAMGEARRIAAHLKRQAFAPGSRIAIFSKNTAHWILADLAIWLAGHVTVPIYPTLTATSIRQILDHSDARLVFVGKLDGYESMAPGIDPKLPRVVLPLAPSEALGDRWEDLVRANEPLQGEVRREPDEMATIVYTSGTTGVPKGVVHSFRTMSAARYWVGYRGLTREDRMLSYLPLAHVAERGLLEVPNFYVGFRVFFAESIDTFVDDLRRARPTLFGSVPRLWVKLQSGVFSKMPEPRLAMLLKVPVVRSVVSKKILAGLGLDAVRIAICGAAPVPEALLRWYADLGLEIGELYGMSENWAMSHAARPGDFCPGYIGPALDGVDVKITSEGEVLVKSPGNMVGYHEAPELTREMLDADGYLHTGDRGQLDAEGRLRITGRVKELFKTSKGKYVAPAPIENLLVAHPAVEQACVTGSGLPQPVALVVLSPAVRAGADVRHDLESLRQAINEKLDGHEKLGRIVVAKEEWTIENGFLTPTLKVKRSAVESRYGSDLSGDGKAGVVFLA
jgi:long-subunit acyl-CoA synthetase (AMP-forming)